MSNFKIKKILRLFSEDIISTKAANILGLNRKTVDRDYSLFREKIFMASIYEMKQLGGEFECDE